MLRLILTALLITALAACGKAKLPDIKPETTRYADGTYGLKEWTPGEARHDTTKTLIRPSDPAFKGAVSWFAQIDKRDPKKAAVTAARREGMKRVKVIAVRRADKKVVKLFEGSKKARVHAVMLKGKLDGKPARSAMLVWYGSYGHAEGVPANSGVHAFMAPKREFEALGGYAIPAARWFGATKTDGKPMTSDGRLSAKMSAKKLAAMYEDWGTAYLDNLMAQQMMGMTMQIQAQTLNQMMTYNNALSTCGGSANCSVEMNGDGTWSADIQ